EAAALERELEALRGDGFDAERFDLGSSALAPLYDAALLHPRDAAIHPARWVRRLAGLAVAAGAELVEAAPVSAGALVELDADAVVVAADALSAELAPELAGVVVPRRGQMLVTEPLDELLFPRPHYARDGFDYWQQLPDRRL